MNLKIHIFVKFILLPNALVSYAEATLETNYVLLTERVSK